MLCCQGTPESSLTGNPEDGFDLQQQIGEEIEEIEDAEHLLWRFLTFRGDGFGESEEISGGVFGDLGVAGLLDRAGAGKHLIAEDLLAGEKIPHGDPHRC
ncbi:hypothetical protein MRB53_014510 [Persea americana]|uniref:Uncharacterized protein n=1 Tax=Persea americana TaxID=3435 RepID=A0ACC2KAZ9_PERAE|nr:hypothetical protein MRB53_014510 [Persea americana]